MRSKLFARSASLSNSGAYDAAKPACSPSRIEPAVAGAVVVVVAGDDVDVGVVAGADVDVVVVAGDDVVVVAGDDVDVVVVTGDDVVVVAGDDVVVVAGAVV